ncbi:putative ankyrin repeat-containing domain-containing protein [Helianthus annuus]|nr:putative ankyrin repeat-containing domain-containing protein [Helianthus annuus]
MADKKHVKHTAIYQAALNDKRGYVSKLMSDGQESLLTERITRFGDTPLHIAVGTNRSNRFVEELVKSIVPDDKKDTEPERLKCLFQKNNYGNSPLHIAAMVGNTDATKRLVELNEKQALVKNNDGNMPLQLAAWHGNKETLEYLLTVQKEEGSLYTGVAGGDLITRTIMAGFNDVALRIIKDHQDIVFEKNSEQGQTALEILAQKPENFASGRRLGFWGRFIYSCKLSFNLSWENHENDRLIKLGIVFLYFQIS